MAYKIICTSESVDILEKGGLFVDRVGGYLQIGDIAVRKWHLKSLTVVVHLANEPLNHDNNNSEDICLLGVTDVWKAVNHADYQRNRSR